MLKELLGQKVAVHFLDGTSVREGVLEELDERFVKYRTEYQLLYIPVTSIRAVALETKERERPRVGFGQ
ncbi:MULTISPECIES: hypothetical protein [Paenibacillus]|uniref:Uncharacterized protein n=1 Tax=Paenibacillus typhae TaxID=1174501 RepID=A0A1G8TDK6_9BACL|nr:MULTISPECIES: hypothetical protein [Paenibacillus]MBY0008920.1 hypothetical protein [Paenibacillus typhae]MDF9842271.1 hypothetical protein [Paenibacillus sp. PastF-2]MDF9848852.1 hypothetical protein [Paenibacillus sp. PastM-2]MDF9855422.1 hypothetical protein [Paenibacillus sp. PastF-1]MDH6480702.1 hypothetical protein [Paenibacillus sp. PastH-2]